MESLRHSNDFGYFVYIQPQLLNPMALSERFREALTSLKILRLMFANWWGRCSNISTRTQLP